MAESSSNPLIREEEYPPARVRDYTQCETAEINKIQNLREVLLNPITELRNEGVIVFPPPVKRTEAGELSVSEKESVLSRDKTGYRANGIMGFIGMERDTNGNLINERLEIRSRFDTGNNEPHLLQYMLQALHGHDTYQTSPEYNTSASFEDQILDLLKYAFPLYLRNAIQKGILKQYVTRKYNDSNLRGPIDFNQHIRKNTPFTGRIAYTQREYSADNYIIQLVRHTIEYLKQQGATSAAGREYRNDVHIIQQATPRYSPHDRLRVITENVQRPVRHGLYAEYRELQEVCLLILEGRRSKFATGNRKLRGILFDGPALWEAYLDTLLKTHYWHPNNKTTIGKQKLFQGYLPGNTVYPDFISKGAEPRIVLDAKYKPAPNIKSDDYMQMLAYLLRFESQKAILVHPYSPRAEGKGEKNKPEPGAGKPAPICQT